eukprot:2239414-Amphidinium_carterae.1
MTAKTRARKSLPPTTLVAFSKQESYISRPQTLHTDPGDRGALEGKHQPILFQSVLPRERVRAKPHVECTY